MTPLPIPSSRPYAAARRAAARHWGALFALTLFLIAGLAVLDDYGVTIDEPTQRLVAERNFLFLRNAGSLPPGHDRFYGVAFELPVLLAERALGVNDSRGVHLSRHLLTHLFFLAGGLFTYLLAHRLFGNRMLALLAMLLFLLHPRIYAHSFYNSKDIPFLAAFMIALFVAHRAFKRDTLAAFVLLGAAAGALINMRAMGVVLLAAVPTMRTLDFAFAQGWMERKRILITTGAFGLAFALTFYVLLPYAWNAPIGLVYDYWKTLSGHPSVQFELFRGAYHRSVNFPADYIPVWFSISSPPFALLLGIIGGAGILFRVVKAPSDALRNTQLRFKLLLVCCFALPIFAVILLSVNTYNGWRHVYFLWAPFSLLAAFGARWLAAAFVQARFRAAVYGAAVVGAAATLSAMALIHPNQQVFFNFLVDRVTPERLRTQYLMDYWRHPMRQAIEWALDQRLSPSVNSHGLQDIVLSMIADNIAILPRDASARASAAASLDALVVMHESWHVQRAYENEASPERALHGIKVYNNTILSIQEKPDLAAARQRVAAREPGIRSLFNVYLEDDAVVYVKEPCAETDEALSHLYEFTLQIIPYNEDDLSPGDEKLAFQFPGYGGLFDGKCVASVPTPYPVAAIRTSLRARYPAPGPTVLWEAEFRANSDAYRETYNRVRGEEPVARSVFDIYLADGKIVYVKEPCAGVDDGRPFFLHLAPERVSDLPEERRRHGFGNLDFEFLLLRGAVFDGKCVASVPLPDYPIRSARTGQFVRGEGEIWSAEFAVAGE